MIEPTWQSECGRVKLWRGDSLDIVPSMPELSIDAIITDPPYSSGGMYRGDRSQSTVSKYVNNDVLIKRNDFNGDTRDQRSFLAWSTMWLNACRYACKPGAVLCCFIDWRQLPTLTDAVQCGGWVWRNLATWWKPGCRMQSGRLSSSAEYVVYASNGPQEIYGEDSPQNVFSCATLSGAKKEHIAEKPAAVARWLIGLSAKDSLVLDPFMGSGVVGVEALNRGRSFWGIDNDQASFEISKRKIIEVLASEDFLSGKLSGPDEQREIFK